MRGIKFRRKDPSMFPRITDLYPYLEADQGNGSGEPAPDANAGGQQGGEGAKQPFATFPDAASFHRRVEREMADKAKSLGFESVAEMEAEIKAAREKADQEKSELDKARDAAAKAEADRKAALEQANARLIRAEVKVVATDLGIVDPDAAYALMDMSGVAVADDGSVTGVKASLEALMKDKPYLKGPTGTTRSGADFSSGNSGAMQRNPWKKETLNLTEQGRILRENPELAKQLQAAAKG